MSLTWPSVADIVDAATRSRMMAGVRGKDTRPEMLIRRALHARGFRYRLHVRGLPGSPDLVFPSRRATIFVHGCFWHGHGCHLSKLPATRREFWRSKFEANAARDRRTRDALVADGWRVLTIWECAMRGRRAFSFEDLIDSVSGWLLQGEQAIEMSGKE